ncbi:MAG: metallophosphoesterase [Myxococcales bacterium]|nr:metallophosphoesterase [Myxococcales bacterium]HIK83735.1 metallophosphoesterase [Myxococcales bacterium]
MPAEPAEIRFAHLSDWHATTLVGGGPALLRFKRLSGWASWGLNRRHRHSQAILEAAFRDVRAQKIDQILVTGDLTHVSLEQEFRMAAKQLSALGTPEEVFLIPGNHDCYVRVSPERSWDLWSGYLAGTCHSELDPATRACLVDLSSNQTIAPRHADYPRLRIHGDLAMIGLCSAIPTPIFRAGGRLGRTQLERLERLLVALEAQNRCRVVMIHHPITKTGESNSRALWDADELRVVLEKAGAELVIHGHKHRRRIAELAGPHGVIPVIGVPSCSEVGSRPERRAQYHVYTARRKQGGRDFVISAEIRSYVDAAGDFEHLDENLF